MNSLEFIKQHVTEWPDGAISVSLTDEGYAVWRHSRKWVFNIDNLSEHFAPSYYDGKVWTREEFEAFGCAPVDWSKAPDWATCYGSVGVTGRHVWYNDEQYQYAGEGFCGCYKFNGNYARKIEDITHIASRSDNFKQAFDPSSVLSKDEVIVELSNKYEREITDRQGNSATVDVYDVLKAFDVTCPATQHALKKLLCTGVRGHKDADSDLIEARESITRAIELRG